KELTGHLAAFGTVFIWGITFVSTKILLASFTPAEILFIRFSLGFAALFIIYPKFAPIYNIKNELLFIFAGFFGIFLYLILENTALSYTFASNVGLLVSISPFISALLAYIFLKDEKLKPLFFAGIFLALSGAAMIIFNGSIVLKLNPAGDILALLAAVSWAVYSLFIKKISFLNIHPIQSTRKIFFYGLMFTLPYLLWTRISLDIKAFTIPKNVLNLIFLGIGASALCFVTWSQAVRFLGTVKTSIYIYFIPVMTVISSIIILDEKLTFYSFTGIILIILGLVISGKK
ncbi:MAG: DMT family transporter, partial [Mucispirillum sp.]|nr:DMT family transporter [Mucispirillum sp.]